jgi:hypothetical protein
MNTEQRIEDIIFEQSLLDEQEKEILRLELEALVIQAQLEQLEKEKE